MQLWSPMELSNSWIYCFSDNPFPCVSTACIPAELNCLKHIFRGGALIHIYSIILDEIFFLTYQSSSCPSAWWPGDGEPRIVKRPTPGVSGGPRVVWVAGLALSRRSITEHRSRCPLVLKAPLSMKYTAQRGQKDSNKDVWSETLLDTGESLSLLIKRSPHPGAAL